MFWNRKKTKEPEPRMETKVYAVQDSVRIEWECPECNYRQSFSWDLPLNPTKGGFVVAGVYCQNCGHYYPHRVESLKQREVELA